MPVSSFNNSSKNNRDHNLITSPLRKKSAEGRISAHKVFEHLKVKKGAESVQLKQPLSKNSI
jgi:hypothetical protein